MTNEPVTYLGAKLRELAAEHGSGVTQLGTLFVRVTCHGNDWALEFSDDKPIDNRVLDEWALAVGVVFETGYGSNNAQHTIVRMTWTGTEDAAPEGTKAFYLGGAK